MHVVHRNIELPSDRDYVLERHCRNNYVCDVPWKRAMPYEEYRREWYSLEGQVEGFLAALAQSMTDERSLAEIVATREGETVAYLWVPFYEDEESGFAFADVQDLYVEEAHRRRGAAAYLMAYAEDKARASGATVIRSGTGSGNRPSIDMHAKLGYYTYRYEFEKQL